MPAEFSNHTVPRLLNLVPKPDPTAIIGRDREVLEVREKLSAGAPVMLVNGIGGIGKTTVAMKYLAVYEHAYKHVAWLTLSSSLPEAFVTDLQLVRSLGLEQTLRQLPPEQLNEAGCRAILQTLMPLDDCLLVLDNANALDQLLEWKNALEACRAHVLVTSRRKPQGWPTVPVESLPPEQARTLFRKYYLFEKPDDAALDKLLTTLDHHTLLTELSAKSAQASRIPFDELLERLQAGYIHDEELNKRAVDTGLSGQSLAERRKVARVEAYVDLIFSEISQLFDGEKEQLKPFTLLPPAEWYTEADLAPVFQKQETELNPNVLDRLVEKGWLQREDEPEKDLAYKMHPLIQEVAVNRLVVTAEWAAPWIQAVAKLIDYDNTDSNHNLFHKNEDKPLAEYLEMRFRATRTEQLAYLLDRIGYLEQNFGQYQRSAQLREQALAIAEELFDADHPNISTHRSNLANDYGYLGRYEESASLLEEALRSDLKNFGPAHPKVAVRQSNLAVVYRNLGRYEESASLLEEALQSAVKNFGPAHPTVAVSQSNLANVYSNLGRYEESASLLEEALQSAVKNFGPAHLNVATRYNNLAHVHFATDRYEEALINFEKALEILRHNFGESHPYIDITLHSIAMVQKKMDE
ncbi:MAG: tetratricopeptide repeat protein [Lewinellaceae bacterium]|nr:tetratricopeptide repeat protein [Saprospiraceae bacterium]MCB9332459.1 tetratricopeptide repeat protein [Lewinellaceae bacterium]